MAERQASKKETTAKRSAGKASNGFTAEEKAAMRERAKEIKAAERRAATMRQGERRARGNRRDGQVRAGSRVWASGIHAIVKASAPGVSPRTWYGMPAYAKDGSVVCFFKPAEKFKSRYATLGFSDKANLDETAPCGRLNLP